MISVIIPTFNRARTIRTAVDSVLSQDYGNIELIIVDDCSSDGTESVIRGYGDRRLRYVRLEKNGGACVARNAGIDCARGEYIAFQDSDDFWHPGKLSVQLGEMERRGAAVSFHRLCKKYTDADGKSKTFLFPGLEETQMRSHEQICLSPQVSTQTILARREVCERHRFDPLVRKGQDYDWSIRASCDYDFLYIADVLADQFIQPDSISRGGSRKIIETRLYFLEKYADEFLGNPAFKLSILKTLAKHKTLVGMDATCEYREILAMEKNMKNGLKYLLAKTGLMKLAYNALNERPSEI